MRGHDDRLETQRRADMYEVTRAPVADKGPLYPRVKQAAEMAGVISMVKWVGSNIWPF
jgi:hypothetical protein